jgi:hypothetical protein
VNCRNDGRVARWYIFIPKIPIWIYLVRPGKGNWWYILWSLEYFTTILCNLYPFGTFLGHMVLFTRLGKFCLEKSGNPERRFRETSPTLSRDHQTMEQQKQKHNFNRISFFCSFLCNCPTARRSGADSTECRTLVTCKKSASVRFPSYKSWLLSLSCIKIQTNIQSMCWSPFYAGKILGAQILFDRIQNNNNSSRLTHKNSFDFL